MPDSLLNVLKFFLVALIWLFFFRAFRAAWVEIRHSGGPGGSNPQLAGVVLPRSTSGDQPPEPSSEPGARRVPSIRLTVISPQDALGQIYDLFGSESVIGRASGCALPMPDDTFVSHLHARIFTRGAEFWIEDLGSTNGSFVNGKKLVSPIPLRPGDKVQIGKTTFEASRSEPVS